MTPTRLALVETDTGIAHIAASTLRERGVEVEVFAGGSALLVDPRAWEFDFYLVDLDAPGIDALELVRMLRQRSAAGVVAFSQQPMLEVFSAVITAGADMYLAKPVLVEHLALAVEAVQRRAATARSASAQWRLDGRARELVAPDGARVGLGEMDITLVETFVRAAGSVVPRSTLLARLNLEQADHADKTLNACVHRLRKRIARATPAIVPLQSQSRVGYVFRAPLSML